MTTTAAPSAILDLRSLGPRGRRLFLEQLCAAVEDGSMSFGDAARVLRSAVLRLDRAAFAKSIGVSERTIAKLEDDRDGNPTLTTLQKVFRPFGVKIGLTLKGPVGEAESSAEETQMRDQLQQLLLGARRRRRSPPHEKTN